ncbi:thioredoxin family protein [Aquimarina mytili]|uniref:Thioredoxin family protein n=1 Tax=Aquimarina mytili TaxID=874423 RepID=A0A936ZSZ4_9FLAO|nr:thioredoxin family protein [Aquimarina mytili]MBL0684857.1 thioredoxin family protein [Aquimarina mytili]
MRTLKILVGVAFVIAISAFAIDKVSVSETDDGYAIGDFATDFELRNVDDTMVSLSDYKDAKGFIVIFTCNHCPYSVAYEDRIIELDNMFKSKGYPVIAINPNNPKAYPDDSFENMKIRAKEKGFTFPYLFDDGQHIYPQYGATKTPHVYVLEKTQNGNVVKYIGAIDNNYKDASAANKKYVQDAVHALLKGEKVPVEITKAIGCSIKA